MPTSSLRDFPRLPVGRIMPDGSVARDVTFAPWTARAELDVADIRKRKNDSQYAHLCHVLAYFARHFAGADLSSQTPKERVDFLMDQPGADIMTAWVLLRIDAMTDKIQVDITCPDPQCGVKGQVDASLWDADVKWASDAPEAREFSYTLQRPLNIDGVGLVQSLQMRLPRFHLLASITQDKLLDIGRFRLETLQESVVGVNGSPGSLKFDQILEMTKADFEGAFAAADARDYGVELSLDGVECQTCKTIIRSTPVDWSFLPFFSRRASSRSGMRILSFGKSSPSPTSGAAGSPST